MKHIYNDGGRAAAGFKGTTRDCVTRAIAIATEQDYQTVYNRLAEGNANYIFGFIFTVVLAEQMDQDEKGQGKWWQLLIVALVWPISLALLVADVVNKLKVKL